MDHPRRTLLKALLGAWTAAQIPFALAAPIDNPAQGDFLALSALIAGQQALDAGLAAALQQALSDLHPDFADQVSQLLALIEARHLDAATLQATLDTEQSPLAVIPRAIARGWFMGIVGSGAQARCIAYEQALNAQIVRDVLQPPSYALGGYGSWTAKPSGSATHG
ncbi:sugar dehydrogenase complex small subunit [Pseudomonas putida]